MAQVYVAYGSNLGDRQENIVRALELIREDKEIDLLKTSTSVESAFEGEGPEQGLFLNGVLLLSTELMPLDILSRLKTVERRLGRMKSQGVNQPRTLDLDILFYDDVVIVDGKTLCIPHPRLHERLFVLGPLLEIAPDFVHPRLGKTIRELHQDLVSRAGSHHPQSA